MNEGFKQAIGYGDNYAGLYDWWRISQDPSEFCDHSNFAFEAQIADHVRFPQLSFLESFLLQRPCGKIWGILFRIQEKGPMADDSWTALVSKDFRGGITQWKERRLGLSVCSVSLSSVWPQGSPYKAMQVWKYRPLLLCKHLIFRYVLPEAMKCNLLKLLIRTVL